MLSKCMNVGEAKVERKLGERCILAFSSGY